MPSCDSNLKKIQAAVGRDGRSWRVPMAVVDYWQTDSHPASTDTSLAEGDKVRLGRTPVDFRGWERDQLAARVSDSVFL
jgi:hypothetical protein